MRTKIIEFDLLITPDGKTYRFNNRIDKFVWGLGGQAIPPIDYITQRGPFQDGETVLDFRLEPRVIQLVHRRNSCSREEYWENRADLLDYLRPNRWTSSTCPTFVLRKILPTGEKRDIQVVYQDGIGFRGSELGMWDEFNIQEPIRFIAHDPLFYNPNENIDTLVLGTIDDELDFPIEFPILFGRTESVPIFALTYTGTYKTYPQIIFTGPMENPVIKNITTNERIELETTIAANRTVIIDTTFGNKTIVDDFGNNLIGALTTDSDFATFHIAPDPEATDGENEFGFTAKGKTSDTEVIIRYFTKYIGI